MHGQGSGHGAGRGFMSEYQSILWTIFISQLILALRQFCKVVMISLFMSEEPEFQRACRGNLAKSSKPDILEFQAKPRFPWLHSLHSCHPTTLNASRGRKPACRVQGSLAAWALAKGSRSDSEGLPPPQTHGLMAPKQLFLSLLESKGWAGPYRLRSVTVSPCETPSRETRTLALWPEKMKT